MSDLVKAMARVICVAAGYNPDAGVYGDGAFHKVWEQYIPQARAAIKAVEGTGWKLAPVEPTDEMIFDGIRAGPLGSNGVTVLAIYRAMLAASPDPLK